MYSFTHYVGIYCATQLSCSFLSNKTQTHFILNKKWTWLFQNFQFNLFNFYSLQTMCFNINSLTDGLINSTHSNWKFVNLEKCQQSVNSLVIENFKCKWIISKSFRYINGLKCDNFFFIKMSLSSVLNGHVLWIRDMFQEIYTKKSRELW